MLYFIGKSRKDGKDVRAYWLQGPELKGRLQNLVVPGGLVEEAAKAGRVNAMQCRVFDSGEPTRTVAYVTTQYAWNNMANDLDREIFVNTGKQDTSEFSVVITGPEEKPCEN